MKPKRDHVFISYASEHSALCDWLARRLASQGYAVWYDRLKLLGGEDWPKDIDAAIDGRTFRMLALLSRASVKKEHPTGEWLKGRAIGKRLRIEDFVIPLNTEGLRPHEIPWYLQTINYIPFAPSWANGLGNLLAKLTSVNTPKTLAAGPQLAVQSVSKRPTVCDQRDQVVSNCLAIERIPRFIHLYRATIDLSIEQRRVLRRMWACRDVSPSLVLAFHAPPATVMAHHSLQFVQSLSWRNNDTVEGIETRNLLVSLICRCMDQLLKARGMAYSLDHDEWYIPRGQFERDRVLFTLPGGKQSWFLGVGERTYPSMHGGEVYRYHISPSFSVLRDQREPSVLLLRLRIYLTDSEGAALRGQRIKSRRKHLCKFWFNREWVARTLGVAQLLAGPDGLMRWGPEGEQQLVINASPFALNSPISICDDVIEDPHETHANRHESDDGGFDDEEWDE